ncbi:MAG TPA: hypothetical protein VJU61_09105 [Polyangiaceae bacterium]|nr:hypothetical protein [Polyangiaceae bacterium]
MVPLAFRGRRWAIALVALLAGGALAVWVGYAWLWSEIRAQAAAQGVQLESCELALRWQSLRLSGCHFALGGAGTEQAARWGLGTARVSGKLAEVELVLAGLRPERVHVRGAEIAVRGEVPWQQFTKSLPGQEASREELPVDVEQSSLTWISGDDPRPWLSLSQLGYRSGSRELSSELVLGEATHGHVALGPGGVMLALGEADRPKLRLTARAGEGRDSLDLSAELRKLPLAELEGPWLSLPAVLRSVALDGRIFASLPVGLNAALPSGDLHLTLAGLQFPVPREVEGLVHGTPPKISGKFGLTRSLDRATFRELEFVTGALVMHGDARLERVGEGATVESSLSGPLPCLAIAESAARAHAGSVLAQWAQRVAQRSLRGSVQVVAAVQGHTSDLPHARVLTSIGVGCGLQPLPIDVEVPRELLERIPAEIRRRMPRLDSLPRLPEPGRLPDPLQLPSLPGWKPVPPRGNGPSAHG